MMKINKISMGFCLLAMMQPLFSEAQSARSKNAASLTQSEKTTLWSPAKLTDGSNVKNGVEFYLQHTACTILQVGESQMIKKNEYKVAPTKTTLEEATLVKLVNTNAFPVKVSYQLSPESQVENVTVPASSFIEGACGSTDATIAKLILKPVEGATKEEEQRRMSFIIEHLVVAEAKN